MAERQSGERPGEKGLVWDKEIDVPEKWIQFVDDNVFPSKFKTGSLGLFLHPACSRTSLHNPPASLVLSCSSSAFWRLCLMVNAHIYII